MYGIWGAYLNLDNEVWRFAMRSALPSRLGGSPPCVKWGLWYGCSDGDNLLNAVV